MDTAHALGLMVLLDVVYNHFGPEGSYIGTYAAEFFTGRHETPWGAGINFDGSSSGPVRQFFIQNALYWIRDFHFDGLRLDAVHAIVDDSPQHLLDELAGRVRQSFPGRQVHLVLENEENEARHLERNQQLEAINFTAQWNDDLHHVLHTAATREDAGYYAEYCGDVHKLGRALAEGFAFQGELMKFRNRTRGTPSAQLPTDAFVAFIQNHDQIGNRAFGERLARISTPLALRAVTAIYLLLPQIPMLFMGEEWNALQPFPFFCDFQGELAEQVRQGRRAEFARFPQFQDPRIREQIPDPQALATFESAKLDWSALEHAAHRDCLSWYQSILEVRKLEIAPRLPRIITAGSRYEILGRLAIRVRWSVAGQETLQLIANLDDEVVESPTQPAGRTLWEENAAADLSLLAPWSVRWSVLTGRES